MIGVVDKGRVGALVLLDLFAAFNTVDRPLRLDYGDEGTVWSSQECSQVGERLPQRQVGSNCSLWKGQFWRRDAAGSASHRDQYSAR